VAVIVMGDCGGAVFVTVAVIVISSVVVVVPLGRVFVTVAVTVITGGVG